MPFIEAKHDKLKLFLYDMTKLNQLFNYDYIMKIMTQVIYKLGNV